MILGIGADLCGISRMRNAVRSARFVEKIFAPEEIAYAMAQGDPARHFASAFAAKEALAKASGWGMFGAGLRSSWVRRTPTGPVFEFDESFAGRLRERGIARCLLTIAHDGDFALAFVVLEA